MTLVASNDGTTPTRRGPFDYSALPANLAKEAKWRAGRINASKERHIIEVGLDLTKMKEKLGHGQFTEWLDSELNFTPATARNYMRVAKEFASKPKTVFVLPPATLYRLAGASPEIRAAIVARVEAGELVDRVEVEEALWRPKAGTAGAPNSSQERQSAAAQELVRRLRAHFTRDEILNMAAIWREAGGGALQAALDGLTTQEAPGGP